MPAGRSSSVSTECKRRDVAQNKIEDEAVALVEGGFADFPRKPEIGPGVRAAISHRVKPLVHFDRVADRRSYFAACPSGVSKQIPAKRRLLWPSERRERRSNLAVNERRQRQRTPTANG